MPSQQSHERGHPTVPREVETQRGLNFLQHEVDSTYWNIGHKHISAP